MPLQLYDELKLGSSGDEKSVAIEGGDEDVDKTSHLSPSKKLNEEVRRTFISRNAVRQLQFLNGSNKKLTGVGLAQRFFENLFHSYCSGEKAGYWRP